MRLIFIISLLFVFTSCQKIELERINKVVTEDAIWQNNSLAVYANLIDVKSNSEVNYGICYSVGKIPFLDIDTAIFVGVTNKPLRYDVKLPQLLSGVDYYVRSFAKTGEEVIYGDVKIVNTQLSTIQLEVSIPALTNTKVLEVIGDITNIGDLNIKEVGHCYATRQNPTINDSRIVANTQVADGKVNFVSSFISPPIDTSIHVRSYIILQDGQAFYSQNKFFILKSHKLTTLSLSRTNNDQDLRMTAMFTQLGTDSLQEYGFCLATNTNTPTINNNRVIVQTIPAENQVFTGNYTKSPNSNVITYYVRPYVISNNEVIYGDVLNLEY